MSSREWIFYMLSFVFFSQLLSLTLFRKDDIKKSAIRTGPDTTNRDTFLDIFRETENVMGFCLNCLHATLGT